jgi:hypothetical protein
MMRVLVCYIILFLGDIYQKPSTMQNSIVINPGSISRVVECAKINLGINKLIVMASSLVAIDEDKLEALKFGCLLEKETILNLSNGTINLGS